MGVPIKSVNIGVKFHTNNGSHTRCGNQCSSKGLQFGLEFYENWVTSNKYWEQNL